MIVQELRHIQERRGYLPEDELRELSKRINVPLRRLHEVASFYPLYRLKPPATVQVAICRDMACHIHGASQLTQSLEAFANEVGNDKVKICGVSCLGQCDRPIAVQMECWETHEEHFFRGKTDVELKALIRQGLEGKPLPPQKADMTPPGWKIDIYGGKATYDVIRSYVKAPQPEAVIEKLKVSGLRGMGGAGFPTHLKWGAVRNEKNDVKYVVCNADESEPGTFKDRELLRLTPHLLIEGMALAGLVTGAKQGYMYIRHEYSEEEHAFAHALKDAYAQGVLGKNILGTNFTFDLEIYVSPGGYIQGEESALLEAIEDRRGEPRNKPPFPTVKGLFGQPTVINNVETLSWTPGIVTHGGEWYRNFGVRGAIGMRFVSISGDVNKPGVFEVPMGQTIQELIFDCAGGMRNGQKLQAVATSGPSGGFLPAQVKTEHLPKPFLEKHSKPGAATYDITQVPLDFDTFRMFGGMLGAAFVVYGDRCDIVQEALNCVEFYRNESCGKCVPCRLGSQKLVDMIKEMIARTFRKEDLGAVSDLAQTMEITSICGLGQVAANPISSVIKHFPDELNRYLGNGQT